MNQLSKSRWGILAAGVFIALVAAGGFTWHIQKALRESRQEVAATSAFEFVVRPFSPNTNRRFETVASPAEFVRAARFQGHFYVAGPEGLLDYDADGTLRKQFSVGAELPSSPVVDLTVATLADSAEPELVLATANEGIVGYNGRTFRQIYAKDSAARAVTCVKDGGAGRLLIGTKARGVLLLYGKRMAPLHATLANVYVTALEGDATDLWVGTLDRGVLHWHAGATETFGTEQGMPDAQVLSIARAREKTYVGTPVGVAVFDGGRFSHVTANGAFAAALEANARELWVGTEDQGVMEVPLEKRVRNATVAGRGNVSQVRQFFSDGLATYTLTKTAVYRAGREGSAWQRVLRPEAVALTDRNISALAEGGSGKLWVGYFDRGLDIVPADGGAVKHIEDERVFCVNRILHEETSGTVDVATANGLVRFSASGNEEQVLRRADGLIADHVTDIAPYRGGLALATPGGLTFLDVSGARSLYAFHGLVNNHVYALGVAGDELVAGTLGGISMIGREMVQVNYTAANSGLRHNWITAIVPVDDGWMVGTYGAGVLALDRNGQFHAFDVATGAFEVNPTAMLVTENYVLAGSLGHGLYVMDRASGRWSVIAEGLPSLNVTALARVGNMIYVGTDNGLVRVEETKLRP